MNEQPILVHPRSSVFVYDCAQPAGGHYEVMPHTRRFTTSKAFAEFITTARNRAEQRFGVYVWGFTRLDGL